MLQVKYFSELNRKVSTEYCPNLRKNEHKLSPAKQQNITETRWHRQFTITHKLFTYLRISQTDLNEGLAHWAVGDRYKCRECRKQWNISAIGPPPPPVTLQSLD